MGAWLLWSSNRTLSSFITELSLCVSIVSQLICRNQRFIFSSYCLQPDCKWGTIKAYLCIRAAPRYILYRWFDKSHNALLVCWDAVGVGDKKSHYTLHCLQMCGYKKKLHRLTQIAHMQTKHSTRGSGGWGGWREGGPHKSVLQVLLSSGERHL